MQRILTIFTLLALSIPAVGCRLCAHPYDYCGPTSLGGRFQPCDPCARAGSILSPGPQYLPGEMVADKHAGTAAEEAEPISPAPDSTSNQTLSPRNTAQDFIWGN